MAENAMTGSVSVIGEGVHLLEHQEKSGDTQGAEAVKKISR
jgi:hypothetical protein